MIGPDVWAVAPWAHPEVLIAVVGAIGVLGSSAAAAEWIKSRRRPKISAEEHEEAAAQQEAAAADELVATALEIVRNGEARIEALVQRHETEIARVNRRLDVQTERGDRLELEVEALKRESREQSRTIFVLRTALARVETWWETEIVARWDVVRQDPAPPVFPHTNTE